MASPQLSLDHIIVLVPYATLRSPPAWITENFTLAPGGRHADGKTENRLICFQDGSYLELIAFVGDDPKLREGHWWDKPFGIVDFAFTARDPHTTAQETHASLQPRLKSIPPTDANSQEAEIRYDAPRAGGRTRPDGTEVKWHVTFPATSAPTSTSTSTSSKAAGYQRGELPFFCHDVTPRELRVPGGEYATHPSGVYGVKELSVFVVDEGRAKTLRAGYKAIFDVEGKSDEEDGVFRTKRLASVPGAPEEVIFRVGVPRERERVEEVGKRGGVLLGDLVFGRRVGGRRVRIDVDGSEKLGEEEEGNAFGIGRVFLDVEDPLVGENGSG